MDRNPKAGTPERKPLEPIGSPSIGKAVREKVKGKIIDVQNLGTVILIRVKRMGLRHLWDKLVGSTHIIPFEHRAFYDMMESLECGVNDLIGQQIEFADQTLYFSEG